MNKNTGSKLRARLENRSALVAEYERTQVAQTENSTALTGLISDGNLEDAQVVNEIIRRQALDALYPRRLLAIEDKIAQLDLELKAAVDGFISGELRSRVTDLGRKIRAKVRSALAFAFTDEHALNTAIEGSELVRKWTEIDCSASIQGNPPNGAANYAETRLALLDKCAELEKTIA